MPDYTPELGFPYALDEDSPAVLAAVTQGMAERAENALQSGEEILTVGASTSEVTQAVTFAEPYDVAPIVVVSQATGSPGFYWGWAEAVTTTGFTMHAMKDGTSGSTTIKCRWHAHGSPA